MAKRNALTLLKAEQKELQARLGQISQAIRILGGEMPFPRIAKRVARKVRKAAKKRKVSAATRAKMRASQRKRWAAKGKK